MMKHAEVQRNLYDFVVGELPDADRSAVEQHLASCPRCSAECAELRKAMTTLARAAGEPSERRSDAYWEGFASGVESRIRLEMQKSRASGHSFWEQLWSFFVLHRGAALAAGAACVLVIAGLLSLSSLTGPRPEGAGKGGPALSEREQPSQPRIIPASERLERYLRKSKTLLVGISNMRTSPGGPIDMSAEREASRMLIREAKYLQGQDIDGRSARLIDDLNKILIELANLEDEHDVPGVEIIRGGIHQENLLFKIRMAEALSDSSSGHRDQTF